MMVSTVPGWLVFYWRPTSCWLRAEGKGTGEGKGKGKGRGEKRGKGGKMRESGEMVKRRRRRR